MISIGVDVAKEKCTICAIKSYGEILFLLKTTSTQSMIWIAIMAKISYVTSFLTIGVVIILQRVPRKYSLRSILTG